MNKIKKVISATTQSDIDKLLIITKLIILKNDLLYVECTREF